jgi:dTDP-4-amino-4,6-dideoxygalactose transaminase
MKRYATDECPLLHNRLLPTTADRDSLRRFLASRDIYCSVHWPAHPLLRKIQDRVDTTDAIWVQDHVLSIPVSQDYGERDMERICEACHDWRRAGSARFNPSAA